jgi:hypothetical protein
MFPPLIKLKQVFKMDVTTFYLYNVNVVRVPISAFSFGVRV